MTTLTRRALIGAAGILVTASLARPTEAQEQWPPAGLTFCDACAGEGWADRFGAYAKGGADSPDRMRYSVMEGENLLLHVMAVTPGPGGWVAELTQCEECLNTGFSVLGCHETCDCGSGDATMRVSYRDGIYLIDHWNDGAIIA